MTKDSTLIPLRRPHYVILLSRSDPDTARSRKLDNKLHENKGAGDLSSFSHRVTKKIIDRERPRKSGLSCRGRSLLNQNKKDTWSAYLLPLPSSTKSRPSRSLASVARLVGFGSKKKPASPGRDAGNISTILGLWKGGRKLRFQPRTFDFRSKYSTASPHNVRLKLQGSRPLFIDKDYRLNLRTKPAHAPRTACTYSMSVI